MSRYDGYRTKGGPIVTVDGDVLDPRHDLFNHSPDGFDWGYCGSGPAQLALAILADHLDNDTEAVNLYQRFKWAVIAGLPKLSWTLTSRDIEEAIRHIRAGETEGGGI